MRKKTILLLLFVLVCWTGAYSQPTDSTSKSTVTTEELRKEYYRCKGVENKCKGDEIVGQASSYSKKAAVAANLGDYEEAAAKSTGAFQGDIPKQKFTLSNVINMSDEDFQNKLTSEERERFLNIAREDSIKAKNMFDAKRAKAIAELKNRYKTYKKDGFSADISDEELESWMDEALKNRDNNFIKNKLKGKVEVATGKPVGEDDRAYIDGLSNDNRCKPPVAEYTKKEKAGSGLAKLRDKCSKGFCKP